MKPKTIALCRHYIMAHEGFRDKVYLDTNGFRTIGFGHNLDASGNDYWRIDLKAAENLFEIDFQEHLEDAWKIPEFNDCPELIQLVLVDMTYQMGLPSVMGFKKMRKALELNNYRKAADEILDSKYARKDSASRAIRNAEIMEYPCICDFPILDISGITWEENVRKQEELTNLLLS